MYFTKQKAVLKSSRTNSNWHGCRNHGWCHFRWQKQGNMWRIARAADISTVSCRCQRPVHPTENLRSIMLGIRLLAPFILSICWFPASMGLACGSKLACSGTIFRSPLSCVITKHYKSME